MTTRSHPPEALGRLGDYALERRLELGLTQEQAASFDRGGPSVATIRLIETKTSRYYQPKTRRQLERTLLWQRGSVDDILDGREPRSVTAIAAGQLLIRRRVELGFQHRDVWCDRRRRFIGAGLVTEAERGDRYVWSERQVVAVERAYQLRRGTWRLNLTGQASALIPAAVAAPAEPAASVLVEDQVLTEMETNGGLPVWRNTAERNLWSALVNGRRPPEELVAAIVGMRVLARDAGEYTGPMERALPRIA